MWAPQALEASTLTPCSGPKLDKTSEGNGYLGFLRRLDPGYWSPRLGNDPSALGESPPLRNSISLNTDYINYDLWGPNTRDPLGIHVIPRSIPSWQSLAFLLVKPNGGLEHIKLI